MFKKSLQLLLILSGLIFLSSCTATLSTATRDAAKLPPLVFTRADYKLSEDVSADSEVNTTYFLGMLMSYKVPGMKNSDVKYGYIKGVNTSVGEQIALYRLLETTPTADFVTNVRYFSSFTSKNFLIIKSYSTKTKVVAKTLTLKTDK